MPSPPQGKELPDAATKLRLVLDYLPCEPCLAQEVQDQELLCTVCARLHRQVAVRQTSRVTVVLERPTPPPAEPVVIPPAPTPASAEAPPAPAPAPGPAPVSTFPVEVVYIDAPSKVRSAATEVVVEPYEDPDAMAYAPPVPVPLEAEPVPDEEPEVAVVAAKAVEPEVAAAPPEEGWDDVVSYRAPEPSEDLFGVAKGSAWERPTPPPSPPPKPAPVPAFDAPEDDFVFRPPPPTEPSTSVPAQEDVPGPEPDEDWMPTDEVRVDPFVQDAPRVEDPWARPPSHEPEPEEAPAAQPAPWPDEPTIVEEAVVETDVLETDVVETEVVEEVPETLEVVEEEVVEMEVVQDEADADEDVVDLQPIDEDETAVGALWRLPGFTSLDEERLAARGITDLAHLAGHDPSELGEATGMRAEILQGWIDVADLMERCGTPLEAALALARAGVAGPRGLRRLDVREVMDRLEALGGRAFPLEDVAAWKRRA